MKDRSDWGGGGGTLRAGTFWSVLADGCEVASDVVLPLKESSENQRLRGRIKVAMTRSPR